MSNNPISKLKVLVSNQFKLSGFFINSESCEYLANLLVPITPENQAKWLRNILGNIQSQGIDTLNVERSRLDQAIRECTQQGLLGEETVFSVIDAFEVPQFKFQEEGKKFVLKAENEPQAMFAECGRKAEYIRERYTVLLQRTQRHPLFSQNAALSKENHRFKLRKAEQLLSTSKVTDVVILGLLTQLSEGKFFVEDPTGVVPLDLTSAVMHSGLYCEGSFVLAEGEYTDGKLIVSGLGFPPPELATSSRAFFGALNTWGGPSKTLLKYSKNLEQFEQRNESDGFIFLSDCWLDVPLVLDKLKVLMDGFDDFPPIAIVLMGPFQKTYDNLYSLKDHLNNLGTIIDETSRIKKETNIVLVPASEDPLPYNVYPRPKLPDSLTTELRRKCPKVVSATNPCRIQYCTQQIVVTRLDLVTKLCRNAIKFPTSGTLDDHFTRTLISQGTLAPINPIALPVLWDFDAAMQLYPLPDVVVIGDPSSAFHARHQDCTVINSGSFPKSKFNFKMYNASTKSVEDSQLPSDE